VTYPSVAVVDQPFSVSIEFGTPEATITAALVGDGTLDTDGPVTLDVNGNYSGEWTVTGYADPTGSFRLEVTEGTHTESTPLITLLNMVVPEQTDNHISVVAKVFGNISGDMYDVEIYPNYPAVTSPLSAEARHIQAGVPIPDDTWTLATASRNPDYDPDIFGSLEYNYFLNVPAIPDDVKNISVVGKVISYVSGATHLLEVYRDYPNTLTGEEAEADHIITIDGGPLVLPNDTMVQATGVKNPDYDPGTPGSREYNYFIDQIRPPYGIGEIWARRPDNTWTVKHPGITKPLKNHNGELYYSALSFECTVESGLDIALTQNDYTDPDEQGEINIDDIEVRLRLADMPQATVKGRPAGAGAGPPVNLTAAQLNEIVSGGGGGPHQFLGSTHEGLTITDLATGQGLVYDGTAMVNADIITRDTDGFWTIGKTTDEFLELLNGSDLIFQNVSGSAVSAASPGSAVAWAYSATRYVTIGWWDSKLRLTDGTDIPDGDAPITYKPSATNTSRELELKVKTTWKGPYADLVIDGTLLNTVGKAMAIREIDVCVDGVAKKMLVLASAPY
jgi:hypothetical protein